MQKPESVGISSAKLKELNTKLHSFVNNKQLAGIQTAIIRKNKLVHFNTYGFSNVEENKPLKNNSIFRIFSMTKPITSVGLMMLYEQEKFKLDDPLYKYIPEFKNISIYDENSGIIKAKRHIRIIDLLRHTSGISYGRTQNKSLNDLYRNAHLRNSKNLREMILKLAKLPLSFEPGTNWEYGYSTDVCGYLIEVLSGKKLDDFLYSNILKPLRMDDTHFQLPKHKIDRFTVGYRTINGKLLVSETPEESRFVNDVHIINGGGGLVSTTKDYLQFCKMLINRGKLNDTQILKTETIALMTKDHLKEVRKFTPRLRLMPRETGFGLGFSIASKSPNKERGVYGWGGAVGTYFRIDPERELIYIMMIQLSPYRQLGLRQKFQQLVNNSIL
ncbi:hypothetical protein BTO18_01695 [Polaribacter porphyrae]|uniref:Beta-lactamase-related domain-containing protein n=1 Tax=Polaribacter porphyrae TaxID=1137780 RepID=A0A2S7WTC6_9FLAO|nr:hypothetical protein BTO18_01695 [Polaribacter porphyrae]